MGDRVRMHEGLLRKTFARFDCDETGMITVDNLRTVLGDTFEDVDVKELIDEVDTDCNGSICYEEFLRSLRTVELDSPGLEQERTRCSPLSRQSTAASRLVYGKLKPPELTQLEPLTPPSQKSARGKAQAALAQNSLMRAAARTVAGS